MGGILIWRREKEKGEHFSTVLMAGGQKKLRVSRCPDLVWSQHTSNASSTAFYNCHDIVQRRQRQRHKYKDECKDKTRTGVESAYHHHPQLLTMWQLKLTIKTTKAYNKRTEPTKETTEAYNKNN